MREAVLQAWKQSWFVNLRVLLKSISILAKIVWVRSSPLFTLLVGFPSVPENWKPGPNYPFDFIQIQASKSAAPEIIETDVLIVGSGCGGAVVARHLAWDCGLGDKVLVIDKGYHFSTEHLPMDSEAGLEHLYENNGMVTSDDGSVTLVAGSCWGGGGTVNWSVMLQTQDYVRREWADQGLSLFTSQAYQDAMDHIWDVVGTSDKAIRHNPGNNVILEGSKKLGWKVKACPQNTGGKEHYCGHCHLGCSSAEKQGPATSWLPDAARAGAKFMEGFTVSKVVLEDGAQGKKIATGVIGTWASRDGNGAVAPPMAERTLRQVHIKAKKVVLSAGSLWSPVLLQNSGLEVRYSPTWTEMGHLYV